MTQLVTGPTSRNASASKKACMNFITSVLRPNRMHNNGLCVQSTGKRPPALLFSCNKCGIQWKIWNATNVASNALQFFLEVAASQISYSLRRIPQTVHFYWTMSSLFSRLRRNICQQRSLKSSFDGNPALMVGHLFHLLHGIDTVKEVASEEGKWKRVNTSRHPHARGKIEFVSGAFDIRGTE